MSRLRIKCFSFESWVDLNKKMGKHFESWVNLNQYLGFHFSHELFRSQFLENRLSHELNRFKSSRYCSKSCHELIRIKALQSNAQKGQRNLQWKPRNSFEIKWKPKKVQRKEVKKVNEISSSFESLSHDLIQIIFLIVFESWVDLNQSSFEVVFFLSRELIWIKIFRKLFVASRFFI